jgi:hypothetical protein
MPLARIADNPARKVAAGIDFRRDEREARPPEIFRLAGA